MQAFTWILRFYYYYYYYYYYYIPNMYSRGTFLWQLGDRGPPTLIMLVPQLITSISEPKKWEWWQSYTFSVPFPFQRSQWWPVMVKYSSELQVRCTWSIRGFFLGQQLGDKQFSSNNRHVFCYDHSLALHNCLLPFWLKPWLHNHRRNAVMNNIIVLLPTNWTHHRVSIFFGHYKAQLTELNCRPELAGSCSRLYFTRLGCRLSESAEFILRLLLSWNNFKTTENSKQNPILRQSYV
jgi:hypothetical protein